MKVLKWLAITVGVLVLVVGIGIAALVYLVDWNDFRDTIQNQVRKQTGRDLEIAGDLEPSVFPWAGISIGEISLANAEGFGETPFARIGGADVKVEVLPLLRRVVNVRTVELRGLELDLRRAADGTTNWDDLVASTSATTSAETVDGAEVTTEVEGSPATIAALEVGGIAITDANVSWTDVQSGTDATLTDFDLVTGAIELAKPFALSIDFDVASESLDLAAAVEGKGEVTIDLDSQSYTLGGFMLTTTATGGALPGGEIEAALGADVLAALGENRIDVANLSLNALGVAMTGSAEVANLDTEPAVTAVLASEPFSPRELMGRLGIEPPVTADESVLSSASLAMSLAATPAAAAMNELEITLDDTTFSGEASVPDLAAAGLPPLRFDFAVDAIDVDRYLPPAAEGDGEAEAPTEEPAEAPAGDGTIALPTELLRQLDVDGTFRVGSVKVANLTTNDIVVPVKAKGGRLALENVGARLYEGALDLTASLDASGATPGYGARVALDGIQADPLLADLLQDDSFLSGAGRFAADITTGGDTVDALKAGLNGTFESAFTDGSINGINIGYQLRRAKAALTGNSLSEDEKNVRTDFTALSVSGRFDDGVMTSDDLDLRSPLLRVGGAGQVALPAETVDYTVTTLVTGTLEGQGGSDLDSLKGIELNVPIRGTFDELAADFAGVMLAGIKDSITGNVADQAKALAEQEAAKLKAQAEEAAAKARAQAEEQLKAREAELREKADAAKSEAEDQVKDRLRGLLK